MHRHAEKCREMKRTVDKCREIQICRDILVTFMTVMTFMTFMTHGNVILDILEPPFRKYSTCWVLQKIEEC